MLSVIIGYSCIINIYTYFAYFKDKYAAENQLWRTPEASLHWLALIGGSPAAILATYMLRHKIRKDGFMDTLYYILGGQIILLALYFSGLGQEIWDKLHE